MSAEEHDMWDGLNIEYEHAYQNNPFKKACITKAISLLKPNSRILDIGCGTGVPVSQMLSLAGMDVVGTDVAPKMVMHAEKRVKGTFEVADMIDYEPPGKFAAVFVIYSQLGLSYKAFRAAAWKFARTLEEGGLMVIGQSPADGKVPEEDPSWVERGVVADGFNLPFMGEDFFTLLFTREGQKEFLRSMGFEILYDTVDVFQPEHPKAHPETQQYVIARRLPDTPVKEPQPAPRQ